MALGQGLVWEQGEGRRPCSRAALGSDAEQPVAQGSSRLVRSWAAQGVQEGSDEHETAVGAEWCDSCSGETGRQSAQSTAQLHIFGMWAPGVPGARLLRRRGDSEVLARPVGVLAFSAGAGWECRMFVMALSVPGCTLADAASPRAADTCPFAEPVRMSSAAVAVLPRARV